jgi:hypothetical protein
MRETIDLKGGEETVAVRHHRRPHRVKIVLSGIVVLVVAALIGWWCIQGATQWKALFLSNNQVYFGHFLRVPFAGTITLSEVYYLQLSQAGQDINTQDESQLKLVKLGSEVHGPTDQMVIPISQVLFWETLRPDSAIVTTIKNGQNQKNP